eukprot:CAMPEP_0197003202 /NCGR_PEP_ID=MMETSP1380-20130617/7541_1 /TAXON_ID=5936 /ORGANISM="Euplotes crassus, Strain CT5" /LENGTH=79 /DNA_ID=CAMNT_0042421639 /DNA_START=283 /DNA_END=519 /DNA_ORIENTATION=+
MKLCSTTLKKYSASPNAGKVAQFMRDSQNVQDESPSYVSPSNIFEGSKNARVEHSSPEYPLENLDEQVMVTMQDVMPGK